MPIGSGTYARTTNSFSNPATGTAVDPTHADALFDDVETTFIALLSLRSRAAADFTKNTNNTLSDVTGLSVTVGAGLTYKFEAILYTTSNASGGVQFAIAGTATATAVIYEAVVIETTAIAAHTRAAALATAVGGVTAVAAALCRITGTITVNAGGTLTVQFAQGVSHASDSKVLIGSTFIAEKIA